MAGNRRILGGLLGGLVLAFAFAQAAQAETCVTLQSERGPAGQACLVQDFTPSRPLTSYAPYQVRLPSDVSVLGGTGTLVAAGPPGGMSTWSFIAPAIPRELVAADGTMALLVGGMRPRDLAQPLGPNGEGGELVQGTITVPAKPAVTSSKLTIRKAGRRRVCETGRQGARSCTTKPRQIVVALRFQSNIALTTPLQVNVTNWRNGRLEPPKLLRRERIWKIGPGKHTLRLVLAARKLERLCASLKHCAVGAGAAHFATDAEQTLVVNPEDGLQAQLRVK